MITLRCTQRLLKRLKANPRTEPDAPSAKLGDWYAQVTALHRRHVVLAVSERTLLPVLLPLAPSATLIPRFLRTSEGSKTAHGSVVFHEGSSTTREVRGANSRVARSDPIPFWRSPSYVPGPDPEPLPAIRLWRPRARNRPRSRIDLPAPISPIHQVTACVRRTNLHRPTTAAAFSTTNVRAIVPKRPATDPRAERA